MAVHPATVRLTGERESRSGLTTKGDGPSQTVLHSSAVDVVVEDGRELGKWLDRRARKGADGPHGKVVSTLPVRQHPTQVKHQTA